MTSTTAEIKSGLAEGDTVITGTAADRIASSDSTTNGFGGGGRGTSAAAGVVVNGGGGITAVIAEPPIISLRDISRTYDMGHVTVPALRVGRPRRRTAGSSSRSSGRPARARAR